MKISFFRLKELLVTIGTICVGIVLIVFGTYGTFYNNPSSSGTIYLMYAFPCALLFFCMMLIMKVVTNGSINLHSYELLPIQLVTLLTFFIFISSVIESPQYMMTGLLTLLASQVVILGVSNINFGPKELLLNFKRFLAILYIGCILAFIGGYFAMFEGKFNIGPIIFYYEKAFWRMNSWYVSSTGLGIFFCYGVYAAFYFLTKSKNLITRLLHVVMIVLFIVGMGLAGGRTAFALLIISFIILFLSRFKLNLRFIIKVTVALLIFMSVGMYFFQKYAEEIYILRRFQGDDTSDAGGRAGFLEKGLNDIQGLRLDQFIFGVGINGTQEVLGWNVSTHSGVLRILLDYGFLSTFLYFSLMISLILYLFTSIRNNNEFRNEKEILLLALVAFFVAEFAVIQLFGVSMEYLIFLSFLSFFVSFRLIKNQLPPQKVLE